MASGGVDGSYLAECRSGPVDSRAGAGFDLRRRPQSEGHEFNKKYKDFTGGDPSSQYVYPGYVLIDVWQRPSKRAKTTDHRTGGGRNWKK